MMVGKRQPSTVVKSMMRRRRRVESQGASCGTSIRASAAPPSHRVCAEIVPGPRTCPAGWPPCGPPGRSCYRCAWEGV